MDSLFLSFLLVLPFGLAVSYYIYRKRKQKEAKLKVEKEEVARQVEETRKKLEEQFDVERKKILETENKSYLQRQKEAEEFNKRWEKHIKESESKAKEIRSNLLQNSSKAPIIKDASQYIRRHPTEDAYEILKTGNYTLGGQTYFIEQGSFIYPNKANYGIAGKKI